MTSVTQVTMLMRSLTHLRRWASRTMSGLVMELQTNSRLQPVQVIHGRVSKHLKSFLPWHRVAANHIAGSIPIQMTGAGHQLRAVM